MFFAHVLRLEKTPQKEQDYIKGFWTSSKRPEAGSSVQFGNVAVSLQNLLMWQLIHTFLKNPIRDETNQKERCGQMIYAVNELINLRGLVSKAAVQRNKMTESSKNLAIQTDIQACSKWPFDFFLFFWLI